jgi:uncharacterized protein YdiU (UPF0061 family)
MSTRFAVRLGDGFARALPELSLPRQAQEVPAPRVLALNTPLAAELGLDPGWLATPEGVGFLVGRALPPEARPVAQGYAGHQFGGYSPRLGDGRALLLGELTDREGRLRDLHLKGSGRTPFSRGGDGQAAVGPMLREHLVSEATPTCCVAWPITPSNVTTRRRARRSSPTSHSSAPSCMPKRGSWRSGCWSASCTA